MVHTLTTTGEVQPDHTMTVVLPDSVPLGRVRVTITVEPEEGLRPLTPRELALSEFVGDWADRQDLPATTEEFTTWRAKRWERSTE